MFATLDIKKTSELYLVRQGWFSPEYMLTDKVYTYGKITFRRFTMCKATAITAAATWIFKRGPILSRRLLITDEIGAIIGRATRELLSRRTVLSLETGFRAEFYRPSVFTPEYVWESEGYGKIMHIKNNPFSLTATIYIDQSMAPAAVLPLLIFSASYLVILRRRRRSTH